MAKAKTLDVSRNSLNALMVTLGFKNCAEWDNAKMGDKLGKLPNIVKGAGKLKLEDELSNLLDDLLNAPDQGLTVNIVDDVEEAAAEEPVEETEEATEEQGEEEATEEEESAPAPKPAAKAVAKPAPKAAPVAKAAPAKAAKTVTATVAAPAKPKAAPKPPPRKTSLTRPQMAAKIVATIETPTSIEDLVAAADQAYVDAGGSSNPKESLWAVRMAVSLLSAIEMVKQEGNVVEVLS